MRVVLTSISLCALFVSGCTGNTTYLSCSTQFRNLKDGSIEKYIGESSAILKEYSVLQKRKTKSFGELKIDGQNPMYFDNLFRSESKIFISSRIYKNFVGDIDRVTGVISVFSDDVSYTHKCKSVKRLGE
jgi:hypothetical protein